MEGLARALGSLTIPALAFIGIAVLALLTWEVLAHRRRRAQRKIAKAQADRVRRRWENRRPAAGSDQPPAA